MSKKKFDSLTEILDVLDGAVSSNQEKKKKKNKKHGASGVSTPASKTDFHKDGEKPFKKDIDAKTIEKNFNDEKHKEILDNIVKEVNEADTCMVAAMADSAASMIKKLRRDLETCEDYAKLDSIRDGIEENELRLKCANARLEKQHQEYEDWCAEKRKAREAERREDAKRALNMLKDKYGKELIEELCA